MFKRFGVGVVAAATMVIPGVSGSMIMMVMGYYNIIIDTITAFVNAAKNLDVNGMVATFAILIPFGIGVLVGIVAVAKLLEFILKKYAMIAYWAICGLIIASPFAIIIFMDLGGVKFLDLITGAVMLAVGFFVSMKLGEKK